MSEVTRIQSVVEYGDPSAAELLERFRRACSTKIPRLGRIAKASDLGQKSIEHLGGIELACSDKRTSRATGRSRPWPRRTTKRRGSCWGLVTPD
jgi:hypothetical protein